MTTVDQTNNGHLAYPIFAQNQVLSHAHLNNVVSYLDAQVRLTRATLIGTGILCGFMPSLTSARDELVLSRGCGITTEGYLMAQEERKLTHYRRADLSADDLPSDLDDLQEVVYELFAGASPADILPEEGNPIVPFNESQDPDAAPLADTLPEMIVVLLLDIEDEERSSCIYDCDEAGIHRTLSVRVLVMTRQDAETVIRHGYDPQGSLFGDADLDKVFNRAYYLPDLCLKRFGYFEGKGAAAPARIDLTRIDSLKAYVNAFARVSGPAEELGNPIHDIAAAYQRAGETFSPFFSSIQPDSDNDFVDLEDRLLELFKKFKVEGMAVRASERLHGIQYFYDYLKDLIQAYEELRTEAFDLMDDCMPSSDRFPRHLMAGEINISGQCPPSVFRSHFTQPAVYNDNGRRLKHVRLLYERMRKIAADFRVSVGEVPETRITLSRSAPALLGERAIPFYYDPEGSLYQSWNFELSRRCRGEKNHSYYPFPSDAPPDDEVSDSLLCDIDGHDFFRIEGHVGKEYSSAIRDIKALRRQYNLPFDVVALKISVLAESEEIDIDYMISDLELFYTKCKHRLLCILDEIEDQVEGDTAEAIKELRHGLTYRKGEEYGDFYDLVRLSENDHFDRFSALHEAIFTEQIGQRYSCLGCDPASIQPILEAYQDRVNQIRQRLLFHKFAKQHPGMEHLGGVPRGGTFILVYINEGEQEVLKQVTRGAFEKAELVRERVPMLLTKNIAETVRESVGTVYEQLIKTLRGRQKYFEAASSALKEAEAVLEGVPGGQELSASIGQLLEREVAVRSNTVVGDFCLPYVCCSKVPPISFVVAQPRPIVLLEEFSYCEDDPGPYDFILHPEGGRLEGPGVEAENSGYHFIPNHPEVLDRPTDSEGKRELTFTYYAEGGVDTLTVEILPRQNAEFVVRDLPESGVICMESDDQATRLLLQPEISGGTFETDGPELDERDGQFYFNPAAVEPGTTVRITYSLPSSDDACAGSTTQSVTVGETPDAGFSGLEEAYCTDDDPVPLTPDTTGSEFTSRFTGEGVRVDEASEEFLFDPSLVEVDTGERIVTITHRIIGPEECPGITEQSVTVYARPDASFRFETAVPDPICVVPGVEPEDYRLIPGVSGGEFTTEIAGETGTRGLIQQDDRVIFRPVEVLPDSSVTITYTVESGPGCAGTSSETVTVVEVSGAGFTVDEAYCVDDAAVTLSPDTTEPDVTSKFSGEGVRFDAENGIYLFDPGQVDIGEASRDVVVVHTVTHEVGCSSTARRTITVHPLPDATFIFEPELPEVLCVDPDAETSEPYQLIPAEGGGTFMTEIGGEVGTTGLQREDETVLFYPGELLAETDVTIIYEVTDPNGCSNRFTQIVTVHYIPSADFEPIPETVAVDEGPIVLAPTAEAPEDGVFTATFGSLENTGRGIFQEGDTTLFEPMILLEFNVSLPHEVIITYTVVDEWGCENRSMQRVVVQPREGDSDGGGTIDLGGGDIVTDVDLTGGGGIIDVSGDFTIVDLGIPAADLDLDPEVSALLADRQMSYAETLGELAREDPAFTETKSFQMVNKYLEVGISRPALKAARLYQEVMSVVLPVYKRAEDPRRSMYGQLIELATRTLLDRVVAENPDDQLLPAVAREVQKIHETDLDLTAVLERWQPDELRNLFPEENVDRFLTFIQ
jgi:hypothetical protein